MAPASACKPALARSAFADRVRQRSCCCCRAGCRVEVVACTWARTGAPRTAAAGRRHQLQLPEAERRALTAARGRPSGRRPRLPRSWLRAQRVLRCPAASATAARQRRPAHGLVAPQRAAAGGRGAPPSPASSADAALPSCCARSWRSARSARRSARRQGRHRTYLPCCGTPPAPPSARRLVSATIAPQPAAAKTFSMRGRRSRDYRRRPVA